MGEPDIGEPAVGLDRRIAWCDVHVPRDPADPEIDAVARRAVLEWEIDAQGFMPDAMPRAIERSHAAPRVHRAVDRLLDRRPTTQSRTRGRPVVLADGDSQLSPEVVSNERPDLPRRLRAGHPPDVKTGDRDTRQDPISVTHLVPVCGVGDSAEQEHHDAGHRDDDGGDRADMAPMGVSSFGHGDYGYG